MHISSPSDSGQACPTEHTPHSSDATASGGDDSTYRASVSSLRTPDFEKTSAPFPGPSPRTLGESTPASVFLDGQEQLQLPVRGQGGMQPHAADSHHPYASHSPHQRQARPLQLTQASLAEEHSSRPSGLPTGGPQRKEFHEETDGALRQQNYNPVQPIPEQQLVDDATAAAAASGGVRAHHPSVNHQVENNRLSSEGIGAQRQFPGHFQHSNQVLIPQIGHNPATHPEQQNHSQQLQHGNRHPLSMTFQHQQRDVQSQNAQQDNRFNAGAQYDAHSQGRQQAARHNADLPQLNMHTIGGPSGAAVYPNHASAPRDASVAQALPRISYLQHRPSQRWRPTPDEKRLLQEEMNRNAYPDIATKERLAARMGVARPQISKWFQHRREALSKSGSFVGVTQRARRTPEELHALNELFDRDPYPSADAMSELANGLSLTQKQVKLWFKHRRHAKMKKGQNRSPIIGSHDPSSLHRLGGVVSLGGDNSAMAMLSASTHDHESPRAGPSSLGIGGLSGYEQSGEVSRMPGAQAAQGISTPPPIAAGQNPSKTPLSSSQLAAPSAMAGPLGALSDHGMAHARVHQRVAETADPQQPAHFQNQPQYPSLVSSSAGMDPNRVDAAGAQRDRQQKFASGTGDSTQKDILGIRPWESLLRRGEQRSAEPQQAQAEKPETVAHGLPSESVFRANMDDGTALKAPIVEHDATDGAGRHQPGKIIQDDASLRGDLGFLQHLRPRSHDKPIGLPQCSGPDVRVQNATPSGGMRLQGDVMYGGMGSEPQHSNLEVLDSAEISAHGSASGISPTNSPSAANEQSVAMDMAQRTALSAVVTCMNRTQLEPEQLGRVSSLLGLGREAVANWLGSPEAARIVGPPPRQEGGSALAGNLPGAGASQPQGQAGVFLTGNVPSAHTSVPGQALAQEAEVPLSAPWYGTGKRANGPETGK